MKYLVNPIYFLERLNELVSSNGIFVIMISTYECIKEKGLFIMNYRWYMYSPPLHLNIYSRKFLDHYLFKNRFIFKDRYLTQGGMFNPFKNYKELCKIIHKMLN